jgi:hypothetical protein
VSGDTRDPVPQDDPPLDPGHPEPGQPDSKRVWRRSCCGWVAGPYPTRTFTCQETPSFARRDNDSACGIVEPDPDAPLPHSRAIGAPLAAHGIVALVGIQFSDHARSITPAAWANNYMQAARLDKRRRLIILKIALFVVKATIGLSIVTMLINITLRIARM